jgi:hypothetical protein
VVPRTPTVEISWAPHSSSPGHSCGKTPLLSIIHTFLHTCTHTHKYTNMCIHTHTHTHTRIHTHSIFCQRGGPCVGGGFGGLGFLNEPSGGAGGESKPWATSMSAVASRMAPELDAPPLTVTQRREVETCGAMQSRVPCVILAGFLGSGKTTTLNHLLTRNHGLKYAVIENEVGEVGIDQDILRESNRLQRDVAEVILMPNGCLCCRVRGDLVQALKKICLEHTDLDGIFIELSGTSLSVSTLRAPCHTTSLPLSPTLDPLPHPPSPSVSITLLPAIPFLSSCPGSSPPLPRPLATPPCTPFCVTRSGGVRTCGTDFLR